MALFSQSPGVFGQRRSRMQRSTLGNPAAMFGRVGGSYGPFAHPAVFIQGMHNVPNPVRNGFADHSQMGNEPNGGVQPLGAGQFPGRIPSIDLKSAGAVGGALNDIDWHTGRGIAVPQGAGDLPGASMFSQRAASSVFGPATHDIDWKSAGPVSPVDWSKYTEPGPPAGAAIGAGASLFTPQTLEANAGGPAQPIPPRPVPDPRFEPQELSDGTMWTPGTPMLPPIQGQPRPQAPQEAPDPVADQIRLIEQRRAARQSLHDRNMGQIQQGAVSGLGLPGDMSLPSSPLSQADQARVNQIRADGRLAFGGLDNFTQRWRRIAAAGQQDEQAAAPGRISGMGTRPTPAAPTGTVLPGQTDPDAQHRERLRQMAETRALAGINPQSEMDALSQYHDDDNNWRLTPEGRRAHLARIREGTIRHNPQGPNLNDPAQRATLAQNLQSRANQRQAMMDRIEQGRQHRIAGARANFLRRNPVFTLGGDIGQLAAMGAIGMDPDAATNQIRNRNTAARDAADQQQAGVTSRIQAYATGAQLFPDDPAKAADYAQKILGGGPFGAGANAPPPTRPVGGAAGGQVGSGDGVESPASPPTLSGLDPRMQQALDGIDLTTADGLDQGHDVLDGLLRAGTAPQEQIDAARRILTQAEQMLPYGKRPAWSQRNKRKKFWTKDMKPGSPAMQTFGSDFGTMGMW